MSADKVEKRAFTTLEELGLVCASYIKAKYHLDEKVLSMKVTDDVLHKDFILTRKGSNVFVSVSHKRTPLPPEHDKIS